MKRNKPKHERTDQAVQLLLSGLDDDGIDALWNSLCGEQANDELAANVPIDVEERKEWAKQSLINFATAYFPEYITSPSAEFHEEFCRIALDVALRRGEYKNKLGFVAAAPRNFAKSSIISLFLIVYCVVYKKKHFIVLFSDTTPQAQSIAENIKREFESNSRLRNDFGNLCGKEYGLRWGVQNFSCAHAVNGQITWRTRIISRGVGSRNRGLREGAFRPDLIICHEKGTVVRADGQWMKVEDHPTARQVTSDGYEVTLASLPRPEVVTGDHRYWARSYPRTSYWRSRTAREPDNWLDVTTLNSTMSCAPWRHNKYYIGLPIDRAVNDPQPITVYKPGGEVLERDSRGRIKRGRNGYTMEVPREFSDPEWWWLIGLWWGDGHTAPHQVGLSIADKDDHIRTRVKTLLDRYGIGWHEIQKQGCTSLTFNHSVLSRWLKSWRSGNSRKLPPPWVECLSHVYQRELIRGYIDADGWVNYEKNEIRLTSVYLDGLYCVRRILARLGIASSIRNGVGPRPYSINGKTGTSTQKYDLRFGSGASLIGYAIQDQKRYTLQQTFVDGDWLWTRVYSILPVTNRVFIPIQTKSHMYETHFGLSHNCDDIENDSNVETDDQRDKLENWLNRATIPMLDPVTGRILFVGTIIHTDSVLSRTLEKTKTLRSQFVGRVWRAIQNGQSIWPERWPLERLLSIKEHNSYAFSTEYMNDPVDESARVIRPEWIQWYTQDDLSFDPTSRSWKYKDERLNIFGFVDPAISEKEKSDDFALIIGGVTSGGPKRKIIVLYVYNGHIDFPAQTEKIIQVRNHFRAKKVGIEDVAYQKALAQEVRVRLRSEGKVRPVSRYLRKYDRIKGSSPVWQQGAVYLRAATEYEEGTADLLDRVRVHHSQYDFYRQVVYYPSVAHNDMIDAMEGLISISGGVEMFANLVNLDVPTSH